MRGGGRGAGGGRTRAGGGALSLTFSIGRWHAARATGVVCLPATSAFAWSRRRSPPRRGPGRGLSGGLTRKLYLAITWAMIVDVTARTAVWEVSANEDVLGLGTGVGEGGGGLGAAAADEATGCP